MGRHKMPKRVGVKVRVSEELYARLWALADQQEQTMQDLLMGMIDYCVEVLEEEKTP